MWFDDSLSNLRFNYLDRTWYWMYQLTSRIKLDHLPHDLISLYFKTISRHKYLLKKQSSTRRWTQSLGLKLLDLIIRFFCKCVLLRVSCVNICIYIIRSVAFVFLRQWAYSLRIKMQCKNLRNKGLRKRKKRKIEVKRVKRKCKACYR